MPSAGCFSPLSSSECDRFPVNSIISNPGIPVPSISRAGEWGGWRSNREIQVCTRWSAKHILRATPLEPVGLGRSWEGKCAAGLRGAAHLDHTGLDGSCNIP